MQTLKTIGAGALCSFGGQFTLIGAQQFDTASGFAFGFGILMTFLGFTSLARLTVGEQGRTKAALRRVQIARDEIALIVDSDGELQTAFEIATELQDAKPDMAVIKAMPAMILSAALLDLHARVDEVKEDLA